MTIMIIYTSQLYNFSMLFCLNTILSNGKTVLFQLKFNFKRVISQVYYMLIFIYF